MLACDRCYSMIGNRVDNFVLSSTDSTAFHAKMASAQSTFTGILVRSLVLSHTFFMDEKANKEDIERFDGLCSLSGKGSTKS